MKYNLIVLVMIISLYKGQKEFKYDKDTKNKTVDEYDTATAEHHTNFQLDMDTVNHAWEQIQQLDDGNKKFILTNEDMGNGKIVFTSPSENIMKAKVWVEHPYKEDELILGFVTKYKWVKQLERLVPTNCTPKDAPTPEKIQVETECIQGVHLGSEVVKVVVTGAVRDDNNDDVEDIAECIKTKVFQEVETEKQKCAVKAIDQGLRGIKQALEQKIRSLEAQGWTCNDTGECHKESKPEVVSTSEEMVVDKKSVSTTSR